MSSDIGFLSLIMPALLVILLVSVVLFIGLDFLLSWLGCYRQVWHPALFRAAIFTMLFCGMSMLLRPWH
jgi:protein AaeX